MEGPPLGPGGEDITWPDQVAPRGRKASSTRKIKPQSSNHIEHVHSTVLPNLADQKCTSATWQCSPPKEWTATQSSIWVSGRSRAQKGGTKSAQNNPINHGNLSGPW